MASHVVLLPIGSINHHEPGIKHILTVLNLNSIITNGSQRATLQIKCEKILKRTRNHHITIQIQCLFFRHKISYKIAEIAGIVTISLVLFDLATVHTTVNHLTTKSSQMTVEPPEPFLWEIIVNQVKTDITMVKNDGLHGRKHLINIAIVSC